MPVFTRPFRQELLEYANLCEVRDSSWKALFESARVDMRPFENDAKGTIDDLTRSSIARTQRAIEAKHDPKELAARARARYSRRLTVPIFDQVCKQNLLRCAELIEAVKTLEIKVSTADGVEEVRAKVVGEYAYYRDKELGLWQVIHVPVGMPVISMPTKASASALAERLHKQIPHPFSNPVFGKRPTNSEELRRFREVFGNPLKGLT
jgi:hypothetical protein